jgi:hypothetical protein
MRNHLINTRLYRREGLPAVLQSCELDVRDNEHTLDVC